MSRFYASIQGSRGEATRQGGGHITGHIRGWDSGVRVNGRVENGEDVFDVYATGGSHNGSGELLGTVRLVDGERVFEAASDG